MWSIKRLGPGCLKMNLEISLNSFENEVLESKMYLVELLWK